MVFPTRLYYNYVVIGVSIALGAFSILVLYLLSLALTISSKGYLLYPTGTSSSILAGSL